MADLNQLLDQATAEADVLAQETVQAHDVVQRMLRLATTLGDSIEAGSSEAHRHFEQLNARLLDADQELTKENATALAGLGLVKEAAATLQTQVGSYLTRIHAELDDLRAEKENARGELLQMGEASRARVLRYSAQVREAEEATDERLAEARRLIAAFREHVDEVREGFSVRREGLVGQMRQLELGARQRLDYLVQNYDSLTAIVQDQVGEVQAGLRSLTEQATSGVTRRLSHDVVSVLSRAAEPLKDAIDSLERFSKESRHTCSDRFTEITGRIEDVTRILERLRPPLDLVRQHLR